MLCHEYKCIFVHIPKTAGQSIEHVFLNLVGLTWKTRSALLLRPNNDPKVGPPALAHLTAWEYLKHGYMTEEQFGSYFKFSFVRNPWDRIVSEYKYRGYHNLADFKTFLFKHLPAPSWNDVYRHIMPQYDYLFDDNDNLLVDFVGRFENLQSDFDHVCKILNIRKTVLPHTNGSESRQAWWKCFAGPKSLVKRKSGGKGYPERSLRYTEYYDVESREYVTHLYRKDIDAFGYQYGK